MNKEKMQTDALESMNTGKEGYFWNKINTEVITGIVNAINPKGFEDGVCNWENFSYKAPWPRKAPPKGTVVFLYMDSTGWTIGISSGKLNNKGNLLASVWVNEFKEDEYEQDIKKWRLPENGMVPKYLIKYKS